jgi:hypothetical protein
MAERASGRATRHWSRRRPPPGPGRPGAAGARRPCRQAPPRPRGQQRQVAAATAHPARHPRPSVVGRGPKDLLTRQADPSLRSGCESLIPKPQPACDTGTGRSICANQPRTRRGTQGAALLLGTRASVGVAGETRRAPCCFTNQGYSGVCQVQPSEGETCASILAYLNSPGSAGKSYCSNTDVRGGWTRVKCRLRR